MSVTDPAPCTNCRQLQARVDALEAELAALKQVVAQLSQQLAAARKDSSTSSKPPSSDIVKPPKSPPPEGQGPAARDRLLRPVWRADVRAVLLDQGEAISRIRVFL